MAYRLRAAIPAANRRHLGRTLLAAALLCAAPLAPTAHATTPFDAMRPVPPAELAGMRGGFIDSSGLVVRFGFDMTTTVNNVLQQRVVVTPIVVVPNVPSIQVAHTDSTGMTTTQQLSTSSLANSAIQFTDLVNGGRTTLSTTLGPNGTLSIVQNQMNNQLIQRAATFNFDIAGMRAALSNQANTIATFQGLRTRALFGH
jgi:hypothetical protein